VKWMGLPLHMATWEDLLDGCPAWFSVSSSMRTCCVLRGKECYVSVSIFFGLGFGYIVVGPSAHVINFVDARAAEES
jgi:hypothetical protein